MNKIEAGAATDWTYTVEQEIRRAEASMDELHEAYGVFGKDYDVVLDNLVDARINLSILRAWIQQQTDATG